MTPIGRDDPRLVACLEVLRRAEPKYGAPTCAYFVPGRIEVLGKHTDYAGGRSLLAATEQGFAVAAVARRDDRVVTLDAATGHMRILPLSPTLASVEGWGRYPGAAVRRLARNFPSARTGAVVAFASDLPPAAGMSSSSALIVATFLILAAINRLEEDARWASLLASPERLAGYLACVENGQTFEDLEGDAGVGTHGGSEDHTAMLCARAGRLVQYAFAPVRFEREIALPPGHHFVVAASGIWAEKAGAARERYNRASTLMRRAGELWRAATGRDDTTVGAGLASVPDAGDRLRAILSRAPETERDALLHRVDHFIAEDREIIPAAGDALARGDLARFGALVDRSQELAERLLGNQVDETVFLARSARQNGAAAASAFGAGFGGSVWALVADADAEQFRERWRSDFLERFPRHSTEALFIETSAGPPATRVL